MFGRGVITSRTTLSPNSTTDWISLRSSSSIRPSSVPAEISASMFSAGVGASSAARGIVGQVDQRLEEGEQATQGRASQRQHPQQRDAAAAASAPLVRR